jgi:hypothetical protein
VDNNNLHASANLIERRGIYILSIDFLGGEEAGPICRSVQPNDGVLE